MLVSGCVTEMGSEVLVEGESPCVQLTNACGEAVPSLSPPGHLVALTRKRHTVYLAWCTGAADIPSIAVSGVKS